MADTVPFTQEGYDRLKAELDNLKSVERPQVILDIAEARAHGDLSENAEYHAAREKQGFVEARIAELEDKISRAQIIVYDGEASDVVKFGAVVHLEEDSTGEVSSYQIVGDLEADIAEKRISIHSPIAKALLGKKLDDLVQVKAPKGEIEYVITGIKYK